LKSYKEILFEDRKVAYELRRSKRARRVCLAVYCDGQVVLTAPFGAKEGAAESFLRQKAEWLVSKLDFFRNFKYNPIILSGNKNLYRENKKKALALAVERADYFCGIYGFSYNKINIKRQKTRWGSCSRKRNLNFNYKIVYLPEKIRDYIIVHELCHLKEFNHSKKFWNLVAGIIPDYAGLRKELKKNKL
jgi:predicted metal-dependent hydrolase